MKNKKRNIICLIAISFLLIISYFLIKIPYHRNIVIEEERASTNYLINNEDEIVQNIQIKRNYISALEMYSTKNQSDVELEVKIFDENDKLLYNNILNNFNINYSTKIVFKDPLTNYKGKNVKLSLRLISQNESLNFQKNKSEGIRIGQYSNKRSYYLLIYVYVALIVLFLILVKMNYQSFFKHLFSTKLMSFSVINNILYFVVSLLASFIGLYLVYLCCYKFKHILRFNLLLISLLFTLCILAYHIFAKYQKEEILKWFLVLAIPISCFYCVFFMPGDGQDGVKHYARAYSIAKGEIFVNSGVADIPEQVPYFKGFGNVNILIEKLTEKTDYSKEYKSVRPLYHPILYTFSAIALFIAKFLNMNPFAGWYLAKIFNMIFALIIGYYIVKKTPKKYKLLFILYILMPMNIYQYVSLSADTFLNFATLWLLAFALNKHETGESLINLDFFKILISGFIIIFAKSAYAIVYIAILFLMRKNIKNSPKWIQKLVLICVSFILLSIGYNHLCKINDLSVANTNYKNMLYGELNMKYLIKNSPLMIRAFVDYVINFPDKYLFDFIGYRFVWSTKSIPIFFSSCYLLALLLSCFMNEKNKSIDRNTILLFIGTFLITFAFVILGMYTQEARSNILLSYIWGVQGRYFIPIYILLLVCLSNYKQIFNKNFNITKLCLCLFGVTHLVYMYYFIEFIV